MIVQRDPLRYNRGLQLIYRVQEFIFGGHVALSQKTATLPSVN